MIQVGLDVFCDYSTAPVIYEVRGLTERPGSQRMDTYSATAATGVPIRNRWSGRGPSDGVIVQCEGGYSDLSSQTALDNAGKEIRTFSNEGSLDPQSNFIKAVRSRRREDVKTDVEQGHLSACLSHLGNISYRLGKSVAPDAVRAALQSDRHVQDRCFHGPRQAPLAARPGLGHREPQLVLAHARLRSQRRRPGRGRRQVE